MASEYLIHLHFKSFSVACDHILYGFTKENETFSSSKSQPHFFHSDGGKRNTTFFIMIIIN